MNRGVKWERVNKSRKIRPISRSHSLEGSFCQHNMEQRRAQASGGLSATAELLIKNLARVSGCFLHVSTWFNYSLLCFIFQYSMLCLCRLLLRYHWCLVSCGSNKAFTDALYSLTNNAAIVYMTVLRQDRSPYDGDKIGLQALLCSNSYFLSVVTW